VNARIKEKKREKRKKEGKWKAGIKTKGGEDVVCDGGDAPFFRDAATYRRARTALKGFTCAELLCRIASRVMVSKEHEISFFCCSDVVSARRHAHMSYVRNSTRKTKGNV